MIKSARYGRVQKNDTIPYGTLANASTELRKAYYYHGYKDDESLPDLPCMPIADDTDCLEDAVYRKELANLLLNAIEELGPKQSKVLRMRHGLGGLNDYTLEEIGSMFRLSRERIRQIEAKAIRRLKHPSRGLGDAIGSKWGKPCATTQSPS